jgi:hypothetical protein
MNEEHRRSRELLWMMGLIETTEEGDTMRVQVGGKNYVGKATCDPIKKMIGGWYVSVDTGTHAFYVHSTPHDCWVYCPGSEIMDCNSNRVQWLECMRKWDEPYGEESV